MDGDQRGFRNGRSYSRRAGEGRVGTVGGCSASLACPWASARHVGFDRYNRLVPMIAAPPRLRPAVALFRSLADPTRLAIVRRLADGEARVVDLTREL